MYVFCKNPIIYLIVILTGAFGMVFSLSLPALSQTTTDRMTCSKAIATYEKNGRVYVRNRSGQALPIYGGAPVSKKGQVVCGWDQSRSGYRVKTTDNKRCVVKYECR